jgi:hypothetical protein
VHLEPLYRATWTRELVGSITHVTGDERYRWLNDRIGAVEGEVRRREDGEAEVVIQVSELVWEPLAASS